MARYSEFLGRRVEVQYRAGDLVLPASGVFVADSGRSIFLEQAFEQRGHHKHFRWEIPYQYIVCLEENTGTEALAIQANPGEKAPASPEKARKPGVAKDLQNSASASAGSASSSARGIFTCPSNPKIA
jgi:hypothetical protein